MQNAKPLAPSVETRQRLLEAGVRLFAEHGFKGVSVRDLSTAAEVNIAAINYHFGGKRGLYRAIFEAILDADEARFRESLDTTRALAEQAHGDPSRLASAIALYVKNLLGQLTAEERIRWFGVLVIREMAFPTEEFDLIYRRRAEPAQQTLASIIAAAGGGNPASPTVRLQAHTLTGMFLGLAVARSVLWRRMDWDGYTPARVAQTAEVVTDLICHALSIDTAPPSA